MTAAKSLYEPMFNIVKKALTDYVNYSSMYEVCTVKKNSVYKDYQCVVCC